MAKSIRSLCFLFLGGLLIWALLAAGLLAAAPRRGFAQEPDPHPNRAHLKNPAYATPENPVTSPSGEYLLVIESGYNGEAYYNSFVVYAVQEPQEPLFVSDTQYRTRDVLYFAWDSSDNIWVYSGDSGTTLWRRLGEGAWGEGYPASQEGATPFP